MKRAIKWALFALLFALLALGGLTLMLTPEYDPSRASATWCGLGLSALFFALAVWLGIKLDKRNMLPE